jgi:hypothetical protein
MEERENQSLQTKISKVSRECDKTNKEKTKHIVQQL